MIDIKPKILIVDDELGICESLSNIFSDKGFYCDIASTGSEALNKMKKDVFDVALIDIRLPDRDGTELVSQLYQSNPRSVYIIMTGYPALENAINALNKGAQGYVVKPVDIEVLSALIEKKLKERAKSEQITEDKMLDYVQKRVKRLSSLEKKKVDA